MDEEHSVHDVAALFKEFLRDMPESLLTKELYMAFINTMCKKKTYTINNPLSSDYFEINVNCVFFVVVLFFYSAEFFRARQCHPAPGVYASSL